MGLNTPELLANLVDNIYGRIVVLFLAGILFKFTNPILGILGFIVALDLIYRSSVETGSDAIDKYVPSDKQQSYDINMYNELPYTLEEEIVKSMTPVVNYNSSNTSSSTFKPVLDNTLDASPL